MAKRQRTQAQIVPLTADDMNRFHRNAPTALEQRGTAFFVENSVNAAEIILVGLAPMVGFLGFDWSAGTLVLFLLIGTWAGIICDIAKYVLLRSLVESEARDWNNDWHVWMVTQALMENRKQVPVSEARAHYIPAVGLFADVLVGGIATAILVALLVRFEPGFPMDCLEAHGFAYTIAATAAFQVAKTIWLILEHRVGGSRKRPAQVQAGARGILLFLLVFLLLLVEERAKEQAGAARLLMLVVNGAYVLLGVLSVFGLFLVRQESVWLREYLAKRPVAEEGAEQ